jgi:hypothetical protein
MAKPVSREHEAPLMDKQLRALKQFSPPRVKANV